jgi:hypothetical protein
MGSEVGRTGPETFYNKLGWSALFDVLECQGVSAGKPGEKEPGKRGEGFLACASRNIVYNKN